MKSIAEMSRDGGVLEGLMKDLSGMNPALDKMLEDPTGLLKDIKFNSAPLKGDEDKIVEESDWVMSRFNGGETIKSPSSRQEILEKVAKTAEAYYRAIGSEDIGTQLFAIEAQLGLALMELRGK